MSATAPATSSNAGGDRPEHRAPTSRALRRWGTVVGLLLSIAGLAWVLRGLIRDPEIFRSALGNPALRVVVLGAAPAYAVLLVLPALAWSLLMRLGSGQITHRSAVAVWLRANIAKYLPGNLFHLVGRQVLGCQHGLSHRAQGLAVLGEMALLAAAAGLVLPLRWLPPDVEGAAIVGLLVALTLVGTIAVTRRVVARRVVARRAVDRHDPVCHDPGMRARAISVLGALAVDALFLLGCGLLLALLVARLETSGAVGRDSASLGLVIGAYGLAWLAGTVTPGAPGGLGVREAVLVLQLGDALTVPVATVAALSLRLVTTLGDGIAAVVAWLIRPSGHLHSTAGNDATTPEIERLSPSPEAASKVRTPTRDESAT